MSVDYRGSGVLVVGDVMLDRYWHGSTGRISPEAPVPVVAVNESEDRPGGAANVALNIASLGADCDLLGIVGRDESADILEKQLTEKSVSCHFLGDSSLRTITKLRIISRQHGLREICFPTTWISSNRWILRA